MIFGILYEIAIEARLLSGQLTTGKLSANQVCAAFSNEFFILHSVTLFDMVIMYKEF
jgi:hypothetical protein